jgi:predicted transcriptional regulator
MEMHDWQIEAIKRGIEAADRGEIVPHEKVKAWAQSLGTRRELPVPKSKRPPFALPPRRR